MRSPAGNVAGRFGSSPAFIAGDKQSFFSGAFLVYPWPNISHTPK